MRRASRLVVEQNREDCRDPGSDDDPDQPGDTLFERCESLIDESESLIDEPESLIDKSKSSGEDALQLAEARLQNLFYAVKPPVHAIEPVGDLSKRSLQMS
jgi:hypothetical protein